MKLRVQFWVAALVILTCQSSFVLAQRSEVTGGISGQVRNINTNSPVQANVIVSARNVKTGLIRFSPVDSNGEYVIPMLPGGKYHIYADCVTPLRCVRRYNSESVHPKGFLVSITESNLWPKPPPIYLRVISEQRNAERLDNETQSLFSAAIKFHIQPVSFTTNSHRLTMPGLAQASQTPATAATVGGQAQLLRVTNATRGGGFVEDELLSLPLPGIRALESLAFLLPGVAPPPQTLSQTAGPGIGSSVGTSGQFAINGLRSRANNFTIDGSDNNDEDIGVRRQGFTTLLPQSVESVQEYHVVTLLPTPQFGRNLGAQVNIISRTGDPRYHGTAYGFYTNDKLKTREFFDGTGGPFNFPILRGIVPVILVSSGNQPKGEGLAPINPVGGEDRFDRRQFGFVLGGPLSKPDRQTNKSNALGISTSTQTLFLLSAEYQRVDATRESHFAVPKVSERGLFKSGDTGLRDVFGPGVFYPTSVDGDAVFSFFPFPNNDFGPYGKNTFTQVLPANAHGLVSSLRLDRAFNGASGGDVMKFSRSQAIAARYNFADDDTLLPVTGNALFSSLRAQTRAQNVALFYNSAFTPGIVNELRASYGRTSLDFLEAPNPFLGGAEEERLPLLFPSRKFPPQGFNDRNFLLNVRSVINGTLPTQPCNPRMMPIGQPCYYSDQLLETEEHLGPVGQIIVSGFSPIGVDVFNFPQQRANNTIQLADTLFINRGTHRITTGFDLRRTQFNSRLERNFRPLLVFNGAADVAADFGFTNRCPMGYCLGADFAAVGAATGAFQTYGITPNASIEPDPTIGLRFWQTDFFAADEIRLRPNLSLTIGARYQYSTVPSEVNGRIESTFNSLEVGNFIEREKLLNNDVSGFEQFLAGRSQIFNPDKNNIAPHIALAWDPVGKGLMVIRGGYGIYFDQIPGAVTSQARNVFPNFLTVNLAGVSHPSRVNQFDLFVHNPASLVAPTLNTFKNASDVLGVCRSSRNDPVAFLLCLNNLSTFTRSGQGKQYPGGPGFILPAADLPNSYSQQWGLTIEHEWRKDFFASIAYVGTRGLHLLRFATPNLGSNGIPIVRDIRPKNQNEVNSPIFLGLVAPPKFGNQFGRPFPFLGSFTSIEADANSTYHSFQAQLNKRLSYGIQFTMAYTWSHAIDEVSDLFDLASGPALPQDSFNRRSERASAGFDIRHNFVYSLVWDLPFAKGNKLLGGWQLSSIGMLRTGQPFSLLACCDVNLDGNLSDRLNRTDGIAQVNQGRTGFTAPAPDDQFKLLAAAGNNGLLGRNTFRAPGVATIDLSFNKRFAINDRQSLELRTEFFNLFNRIHFGVPVHQQGFPAFGKSVDTRLSRLTLQLALKYSF